MKFATGIIGGWVALLLFGCAHHSTIASAPIGVVAEYVGSTPADIPVREFIGGLANGAACHSIVWQLTLLTNRNSGTPSTFRLTALYRVPTKSNPNRSEDGPKAALEGTWEIFKGAKSRPEGTVFRITAAKSKRSLSFVKVGDPLLHLLNEDGSLAIGNGGESYTLNHVDRAEKAVDASLAMTVPDMSYKIAPMAKGPKVFAVFEGRSPCHGISRELKSPQHVGCTKAKWRVTLYQNPETSAPTTCKVEGSLFRAGAREGTWSITRGAAIDLNATVYQLNATDTQPALLFLKGDDNVLFFLNQNRELLVGHAEFSYTLNRAVAK